MSDDLSISDKVKPLNGKDISEVAVDGKKFKWLVIQSSNTGDTTGPWNNLMEVDVPDWVKDTDVMARMLDGEMVSIKEDELHGMWYRAIEVDKDNVPIPTEH